MRLTDEELRDVLERAEEIQRTTLLGDAMHAELAAVIGAAEEVGLSRVAVERALRERLELIKPPAVGDRVFAKSADNKHYVADVISVGEDEVRVRFLRGSEYVVTPDQLKPFSLVPGQRVMFEWPWWGPWSCAVVRYDPVSQYLTLSDRWGSTSPAHIADIWLAPERKDDQRGMRRRMYATLIGLGAGAGAIIGSIITALIMM